MQPRLCLHFKITLNYLKGKATANNRYSVIAANMEDAVWLESCRIRGHLNDSDLFFWVSKKNYQIEVSDKSDYINYNYSTPPSLCLLLQLCPLLTLLWAQPSCY